MAQELELVLKIKYEPHPSSYLDESKALSDITPAYMAQCDLEEFTDDPDAFVEWIGNHADYGMDIKINVVAND